RSGRGGSRKGSAPVPARDALASARCLTEMLGLEPLAVAAALASYLPARRDQRYRLPRRSRRASSAERRRRSAPSAQQPTGRVILLPPRYLPGQAPLLRAPPRKISEHLLIVSRSSAFGPTNCQDLLSRHPSHAQHRLRLTFGEPFRSLSSTGSKRYANKFSRVPPCLSRTDVLPARGLHRCRGSRSALVRSCDLAQRPGTE